MHSTRITFAAAIALAVAAVVACGDSGSSSSPGAASSSSSSSGSTTSSSGSSGSSGSPDDGGEGDDATSKANALAPTGKTSVAANIGGVTKTLTRAQFGTETSDAGKPLAYVEAHLGGDPACPSTDGDAGGAQPDYTLIVSNVPRGNPGDVFTKADGVGSAYFDFKGDQLTNAPLTKASAVTVTLVKSDATSFEIEIDATFAEGTAKGRIAASYCESLSQ